MERLTQRSRTRAHIHRRKGKFAAEVPYQPLQTPDVIYINFLSDNSDNMVLIQETLRMRTLTNTY